MDTFIEFTERRIEIPACPASQGETGAVVEFQGIVRGIENGRQIAGLNYEAHIPMAKQQLERIVEELVKAHPCQTLWFSHRIGWIPVGEASLYIRVHSPHRGEAFRFVTALIDLLKADVPIWKAAPDGL